MPIAKSETLQQVAQLAEMAKVEVMVQEVVPGILEEKSESWKYIWKLVEEGRVRGKVVAKIG